MNEFLINTGTVYEGFKREDLLLRDYSARDSTQGLDRNCQVHAKILRFIPSFMSRAAQIRFDDPRMKKQLSFGGTYLKKAKNRHDRPVSSKHPMHLVLRSSAASRVRSFRSPQNVKLVRRIVENHIKKYGIRLFEFSNNGNHLHFLVKFPSRAIYLRFIRSITGALALAITGANKFNSVKDILGRKFWDFRPFSRVVVGLRGYRITRDYVVLNQLEQLGMIPHRQERLRGLSPPEALYFLKC